MKRKCTAWLLAILALTFCILPLSAHAAPPSVTISNVSGAVYPGCTMTVAVLVSGEGIKGLQGNPVKYDKKQLTPAGDPQPGMDGWICSVGEKNFIAVPAAQSGDTVSGSNLALVKFSFTLNEGVKVGDTIDLSIDNVRVAAKENYSGNLKFSVTVVEEPINTNCDLVVFSCAQGAFTPEFDETSSVSDYTVTVKPWVNQLDLNIVTASELSTFVVQGNENFQNGENIITVTVTSKVGNTRVYTLTVIRRDTVSNDAKLASLEVPEYIFSPAFSPDIYEYSLTVPNDVTSIEVNAAAEQEGAVVTVAGNEELAIDQNDVTVTVTADDENTVAVYTIRVNREHIIETDSSLAGISLLDYEIDPAFDPAASEQVYTITVPFDVIDLTDLKVETTSRYARCVIDDPGVLAVGANDIGITVTSEDEQSVTQYRLVIDRQPKPASTDAKLKNLVCSQGSLQPEFAPDVYSYSLMVPEDLESVSFFAVAEDPAATVEQVELSLTEENNIAKIVCKAEDGSEQEYTVYVYKPGKIAEPALILSGTPMVGEKITATFIGRTGGAFAWFIDGEPVENCTSPSYTILPEDAGKTLSASYTDADGTVYTASAGAVLEKPAANDGLNLAKLIIAIAVPVLALALGVLFGVLFTKKKQRKQSKEAAPDAEETAEEPAEDPADEQPVEDRDQNEE